MYEIILISFQQPCRLGYNNTTCNALSQKYTKGQSFWVEMKQDGTHILAKLEKCTYALDYAVNNMNVTWRRYTFPFKLVFRILSFKLNILCNEIFCKVFIILQQNSKQFYCIRLIINESFLDLKIVYFDTSIPKSTRYSLIDRFISKPSGLCGQIAYFLQTSVASMHSWLDLLHVLFL